MSREKQTEELRDFLASIDGKNGIHIMGYVPLAEALYEAGYRKQNDVKRGVWDTYETDRIVHYRCLFCGTDRTYTKGNHIAPRKCRICGAEMRVRQ